MMTWVDVVARANKELDNIGLEPFSGEVLESNRGRMYKPFLVRDNSVLVKDMDQDFGVSLRDLAAHELAADIMADRAGLPGLDTYTSDDWERFRDLFSVLDEGEVSSYALGDEKRERENMSLLMREKGQELEEIYSIADEEFDRLNEESAEILAYIDGKYEEEYFDNIPGFWGAFTRDFIGAQCRRRHYDDHLEDIDRLIEYEGTTERGRRNFQELRERMPELKENDIERLNVYEEAKQSIEHEFDDLVGGADSELLSASIFYRDAGSAGFDPIRNPDEYLEEVRSREYMTDEVYSGVEELVSNTVKRRKSSEGSIEDIYKSTVRDYLN